MFTRLLTLSLFSVGSVLASSIPSIYQISTRPFLYELSLKYEKQINLHSEEGREIVLDEVLQLQHQYHFDTIWFLGIWSIGDYGVWHDRTKKDFNDTLPGYTDEDVIGSPFAITSYTTNPEIGTDEAFLELKKTLNGKGIKIMLDFIPNHVAVDHPWTCSHPEYLMEFTKDFSDDKNNCMEQKQFTVVPPCQKEKETPRSFYYGADYWQSGWTDTVQLNYWNPELRKAQIENLKHVASMADSIRIDMAMTLLNYHIMVTWVDDVRNEDVCVCATGKRGAMAEKYINKSIPEFWPEALQQVREAHPHIVFAAENYNYRFTKPAEDMMLREMGFDYYYDMNALKLLKAGSDDFRRYVTGQGERYFKNAIHFVENHDDNRAAGEVLHSVARAKAGAVAMTLLPGGRLFNHGQFECYTHKLQVHLRRSVAEPADPECKALFEDLVPLTVDEIAQKGHWLGVTGPYAAHEHDPYGANRDIIAYKWAYNNKRRLVVVNWGENDSEGAILLDGIQDVSGQTVVTQRLGDAVEHNIDSLVLRDAGIEFKLPAYGYQVYDYEV